MNLYFYIFKILMNNKIIINNVRKPHHSKK
jgi:hypothetical protein